MNRTELNKIKICLLLKSYFCFIVIYNFFFYHITYDIPAFISISLQTQASFYIVTVLK